MTGGLALLFGLLLLTPLGMQLWRWSVLPADAPVIGVCYDRAWHARAGISTKNYEACLTQVGAKILELDPAEDNPRQVLDGVDALLLTGGGDVDPALYGGDVATAQLVDRPRDDFEIALIQEALNRDMPILGICRGLQILNVAGGGTVQNLRDDPAADERHGIDLSSFAAHGVSVESGTRLAEMIGSGSHEVNSFHGQGVDRVAENLQVSAVAEDGLVEALERPDRSFVVATQWHPEIPPPTLDVFRRLVTEARAYRQRASEISWQQQQAGVRSTSTDDHD